ncbi:hypothetical protein BDF19DRAFT_424643 [Syncephalis fuscata]|nr:hypothetical protein BDF19DRAFT_424643 [Syncephalis fuscata]
MDDNSTLEVAAALDKPVSMANDIGQQNDAAINFHDDSKLYSSSISTLLSYPQVTAIKSDIESLYQSVVTESGQSNDQDARQQAFDYDNFSLGIINIKQDLFGHSNVFEGFQNSDKHDTNLLNFLSEHLNDSTNLLDCLKDNSLPQVSPRRIARDKEPFIETITADLEEAMQRASILCHKNKSDNAPQDPIQSLQCVKAWKGENLLLRSYYTQKQGNINQINNSNDERGRLYLQVMQTSFIEPCHINNGHVYVEVASANSKGHLENRPDAQARSVPLLFDKEIKFENELNITTSSNGYVMIMAKHLSEANASHNLRRDRGLRSLLINPKRSLNNFFTSRRENNNLSVSLASNRHKTSIKSDSCSDTGSHSSYSVDTSSNTADCSVSHNPSALSTPNCKLLSKEAAVCRVSINQLVPLQLTEYRWRLRIPENHNASDDVVLSADSNENIADGRVCGSILVRAIYIPYYCHVPSYRLPTSFETCSRVIAEQLWHRRVHAEGILQQRGGGLTFWRRRHAQLVGAIIQFRDPVTMAPITCVNLCQLLSVTVPSEKDTTEWATTMSFAFRLQFPDGELELGASSIEERNCWTTALFNIIDKSIPPLHDWIEEAFIQQTVFEAIETGSNTMLKLTDLDHHNISRYGSRYRAGVNGCHLQSRANNKTGLAARPSTLRRRPARRLHYSRSRRSCKAPQLKKRYQAPSKLFIPSSSSSSSSSSSFVVDKDNQHQRQLVVNSMEST